MSLVLPVSREGLKEDGLRIFQIVLAGVWNNSICHIALKDRVWLFGIYGKPQNNNNGSTLV